MWAASIVHKSRTYIDPGLVMLLLAAEVGNLPIHSERFGLGRIGNLFQALLLLHGLVERIAKPLQLRIARSLIMPLLSLPSPSVPARPSARRRRIRPRLPWPWGTWEWVCLSGEKFASFGFRQYLEVWARA